MDNKESMIRMFDDYYKRYGERAFILDVLNKETKEIKAILKEIEDKESFDTKYLITDESIKQGEVINLLNEIWLVLEKPIGYYKNYNKTLIRKTEPINFIFKKPYSVPSIINTKVMDLNTGKDLVLADGTIQLIIQNNELTRQLKLGQRFLKSNYIEPNAFKVEGIDSISSKGLLILTCKKDQPNSATDDYENQYANYIEVKQHNYSLEIKNGKDINMRLVDKLDVVVVVKDNGVVVENPKLKFSRDCVGIVDVSSTGIITATRSGDCTITVEFEGVKEEINIKVIKEDVPKVEDNYSLELIGKDKITIGGSYICNAIVRNNGVEVNTPINFKVENIDSFNKELATITANKDDKEITVQVTKDVNAKGKKFKVITTLNANGKTIIQEKIVKITGMWG